MNVTRWTAISVEPWEGGGFVSYADYKQLEAEKRELEEKLAAAEADKAYLENCQATSRATLRSVQGELQKKDTAIESLNLRVARLVDALKPMYIFYMIEVERVGWLVGRQGGQLAFTNHAEEALTFYDKHSAEIILADFFGSKESYMHPTTYGKVSVTEHAWCNGPDALSSESDSQSVESYRNGVKAEALEEGADNVNMLYPFSSELATQAECAQELRRLAQELRKETK